MAWGALIMLTSWWTTGRCVSCVWFFFFQAEDGIRDLTVTGVQTCALPIFTVTGRRNGREERFATAARFDGPPSGVGYLQQLWAARKAGALSREIRLHGPNPEIDRKSVV